MQIDSFAAARDGEMHEATRRILSVLLRQVILVHETSMFEQDLMLQSYICVFVKSYESKYNCNSKNLDLEA